LNTLLSWPSTPTERTSGGDAGHERYAVRQTRGLPWSFIFVPIEPRIVRETARVMLVEDHAAYRRALAFLLTHEEPGIEVVA
jgi:hypothetical protein